MLEDFNFEELIDGSDLSEGLATAGGTNSTKNSPQYSATEGGTYRDCIAAVISV